MSQSQVYHLSLTPHYLPDRRSPQTLTGQVAFATGGSERVACRVEVSAEWKPGGVIDVAEPDPPALSDLGRDEIQERARRFVAQFRDDKLADWADPDAEDRELEAFQASES